MRSRARRGRRSRSAGVRRHRARSCAGRPTAPCASADARSSSGTIAKRSSSTGFCSLSSADSVSRSSTRPLHVARLLVHQLQIARRCWRSSSSRSCSVSTKPLTTVSGVLSSCETLAMKSRRIRATASSCGDVARHQELLLVAERHDLDRQACTPGSRCDATTIDVAEVAGFEVADDFGLPDEIGDRLSAIAASRSSPSCASARGFAQSMRFAASSTTMPSGIASAACGIAR